MSTSSSSSLAFPSYRHWLVPGPTRVHPEVLEGIGLVCLLLKRRVQFAGMGFSSWSFSSLSSQMQSTVIPSQAPMSKKSSICYTKELNAKLLRCWRCETTRMHITKVLYSFTIQDQFGLCFILIPMRSCLLNRLGCYHDGWSNVGALGCFEERSEGDLIITSYISVFITTRDSHSLRTRSLEIRFLVWRMGSMDTV